jgi:predicted ATPase/class 3 adenylate cyclase
MRALPRGTVTFLFTDIEGSTRLLHELGGAYAEALAEHRRVLREAFRRHGGVEVDTQGDAFFVAFESTREAVAAASEAQAALDDGPIRVRMGLHTGKPQVAGEGYVGLDVHLGARVAAAGHGGQVVLSQWTRDELDAELVDLGEHRLKDFSEPVWIFQLPSDEQFPPLKTISNTNLPRPASTFVGRERERAEIVSLVREGARLVTLTGPGGSGKTRLAIEAATELVPEHKNGVFWVGLASLRDPALVLDTIAQTLGAKDGAAEHIVERELLLLLDNLEQVIEAARDLAALVEACPSLRLLVTSRELLRVRGEVEYAVLPLADPDAVELFCSRANVAPGDAVAELCRRLDNLPLAIELAAARASVLSPQQLLDRLSQRLDLLRGGRDAEARQQTLRATIAWSHDLLDDREQRLFARLAVFVGGCTLEAAEEVAGAELDTLQSLVEKSLLRHTDERFWMLETIRDFAIVRLNESEEADELRRRHAAHCLDLVESLAPHLRGSAQTAAFERLDAEHANLRAALQFGADHDPELLVRLGGGLGYFWLVRGHIDDATRWVREGLHTGAGDARARGLLLCIVGRAALTQGVTEEARALFDEARLLARECGDHGSYATALRNLGELAAGQGDGSSARAFFREALAVSGAHGEEWTAGATAVNLSDLALAESRWTDAYELGERGAAQLAEIGDQVAAATGLYNAAVAALRLGKLPNSRNLLERAAAVGSGDPGVVAFVLEALAWLLACAGRGAEAAEALGCAGMELERQMLSRGPSGEAIHSEARRLAAESMPAETFEPTVARGRNVPLEVAVQRALVNLD